MILSKASLLVQLRLNKPNTSNPFFTQLLHALILLVPPARLSLVFQYLHQTRENTVFQVWPNERQMGWNNHIPLSADYSGHYSACCPHCSQGTQPARALLVIHWEWSPGSFPANVHSSQADPSMLYSCLSLIYPSCRTQLC